MAKQKLYSSFKPPNRTKHDRELEKNNLKASSQKELNEQKLKRKNKKTRIKQVIMITIAVIMVVSMILPAIAGFI